MNRLIFSLIILVASNLIGSAFASVPTIGDRSSTGSGNWAMNASPDDQPVVDSKACDRYLDAWEQFIKDVTPLLEGMMSGDVSMIQKYTDIVTQYTPLLLDSAQIYVPQFNEAQTKRFETLSAKYAENVQRISHSTATEENVEMMEDDNVDGEGFIQPTNCGCDRVIDEYEKMVDEAILICKKEVNDSETVFLELLPIATRIQAISREMANCNFSDEEQLRIQKINEKLTSAEQSLSE